MGDKMQDSFTSTAARTSRSTYLHVSLQESMQICLCLILDLSDE